jgi:hypothetical protein
VSTAVITPTMENARPTGGFSDRGRTGALEREVLGGYEGDSCRARLVVGLLGLVARLTLCHGTAAPIPRRASRLSCSDSDPKLVPQKRASFRSKGRLCRGRKTCSVKLARPFFLSLVALGPRLQCPHVPVWVLEPYVLNSPDVLNVTYINTPGSQRATSLIYVLHRRDELRT